MTTIVWTLADRLRKARELSGESQAELAAILGVSRGTVGNAERGTTTPGLQTLSEWAKHCGVSVAWVIDGVSE